MKDVDVRLARYAEAKDHRARLLQSGEYIKTGGRRVTISLIRPKDPQNPTLAEIRNATKVHGVISMTNFEQGIAFAESEEWAREHGNAMTRLHDFLNRTIPLPDPDEEIATLTCHCGRIACRHHQED